MGDRADRIILSDRLGGVVMNSRYPTLTACAEGVLGAFFRQCESPEELKMREEAALVAVTRLYERRMTEIRTEQEMQHHVGDLPKGEDNG